MGVEVLNNGAEVTSDPEHPELGRFLRATRRLRPGELVLREPALLRVQSSGRARPPEAAGEALRTAGLFVPGPSSPVVSQLRREASRGESEEAFFVRCALHFNSFAAGPAGCDRVTFATLTRANHSCLPNCMVDGDEGTLRALRDIEPGTDLSVSYLDDAALLWPRHRRQAELSQRWDFICGCERCTAQLDDARRFRGCRAEGCGGELLVAGAASGPSLLCERCRKAPSEAEARALFVEEAAAVKALEMAKGGDLEEEDEGQELMRCHRFGSRHPTHAAALELAHDFDFPDALPAQRALLAGLEAVLPGLPCQLAVTAGKGLAELLAARGEAAEAWASLEAAAAVACVLDGRGGAEEVLEEWRRPRPPRAAAAFRAGGPPLPKPSAGGADWPDLDLDLGPPPTPQPAAAAAEAVPSPAVLPVTKAAGAAAEADATDGGTQPPVERKAPPLQLSAVHWAVPASLALAAAVAILASAWTLRHRARS